MRSPSNRFLRAMQLRAEFRDMVPDNLLEEFAHAITQSSEFEARGPLSHDQLNRIFVYGREPVGDEDLLFAPLTDVMYHAVEYELQRVAKTFGEFFDGLPGHMGVIYREELAMACEYPTFDDYARANPDDLDVNDTDALLAAWKDLPSCWDRLPLDEEEFDGSEWLEMTFDRSWRFYDLKVEIYGTVPGPIVSKYGKAGWGVHDGPYIQFYWDEREVIIKDFEALGYTIVHDQDLIDSVYGAGPGLEAIRERVEKYQSMLRVLEELEDIEDRADSGDR